jgi:hypothetical protein
VKLALPSRKKRSKSSISNCVALSFRARGTGLVSWCLGLAPHCHRPGSRYSNAELRCCCCYNLIAKSILCYSIPGHRSTTHEYFPGTLSVRSWIVQGYYIHRSCVPIRSLVIEDCQPTSVQFRRPFTLHSPIKQWEADEAFVGLFGEDSMNHSSLLQLGELCWCYCSCRVSSPKGSHVWCRRLRRNADFDV